VTKPEHPVDEALKQVAGDPTPSEDYRRMGADRLAQAIAAEQQPRRWHRPRAALGWAFALVVIFAAGVLVMVEVLSPTATEAAFEEIAEAAEQADPLAIPAQQFAYTRSEVTALMIVSAEAFENVEFEKDFLTYVLPTTREVWIGSEGTVQIRTTNQTPTFFTEADEDVYYQAGIDQEDAIGETITLTTTDQPTIPNWPTNPKDLDQAIRHVAVTDRGLPVSVEYLDVALDILRETLATPELRAATLRLIGQLPGLQVADTDTDQATTFSITYQHQEIQTRQSFTLSSEGALLEEETWILEPHPRFDIPANTPTVAATHDPPILVDSLNRP
jgi:hypothetical protein